MGLRNAVAACHPVGGVLGALLAPLSEVQSDHAQGEVREEEAEQDGTPVQGPAVDAAAKVV